MEGATVEAIQETAPVPPPGYRGPRGATSRRIVALGVGESCTFPYAERATVTGTANSWGGKLKRGFASRRDRKDRSRLRLYRIK